MCYNIETGGDRMNFNEKQAVRLIDKLYKDLYLSKEVLHHGNHNKYDKFNNIKSYLDNLEYVHNKVFELKRHIDYLKNCYYDKYVIKRENIKESYYKHKLQLIKENGYGYLKLTPKLIKKYQDEVIGNQKNSLDIWIDYLFSADTIDYPFWVKYWAFQGMLKLGSYNEETGTFNKRTKYTIEPFIDLNKEVLLKSINLMLNFLNKEKLEDKDLLTLINSGSFSKIYLYFIRDIHKENKKSGIWIQYSKKDDYIKLIESLQGYNTKWCTKNKDTAKSQLNEGNLFIYYTLDKNNQYKIPRIAIRMKGNEIVEIKGIGKYQNLEPDMEKIVEEKIQTFSDGNKYYKKVNNMKQLTIIYNKHLRKEPLTKEELYFLYEIEEKILGFGLKKDPRIKEIIRKRNIKEDISLSLGCKKEQIALKQKEINKNTIYYRGYLSYNENDKNKVLPKIIGDYLSLEEKYIEGMFSTQIVGGSLFLNKLCEVKNLVLSKIVCGSVYINNLISGGTLILPRRVEGNVELEKLEKMQILVLPSYLGGSLFLNNLKSINTLVLPKIIGGFLHIDHITNPRGFVFEKEFTGNISMNGLESAESLIFPNTFTGTLSLDGLKSPKGLVLPKNFNGNISMKGLKRVKGLVLPDNFTGNLYLNEVIDIERLNVDDVNYNVYVNGVKINTKNKVLSLKK